MTHKCPNTNKVDWDLLEEQGHLFVLLTPLHGGISTYWCEHCGTVMLVRNMDIVIWHEPGCREPCVDGCPGTDFKSQKTLRDKLDQMVLDDWEKLKSI